MLLQQDEPASSTTEGRISCENWDGPEHIEKNLIKVHTNQGYLQCGKLVEYMKMARAHWPPPSHREQLQGSWCIRNL